MASPALFDELERTLAAYRKSRFTMIGHAIFIGLCLGFVVLARRVFGMPPQVLGLVFIVALVVFGRDIMTFLHLRSKLAQLRAAAGNAS